MRGNRRIRRLEEAFFVTLMRLVVVVAALLVGLILGVVAIRGIGALTVEMLTQPPGSGYYMGGGGGILNAIAGSLLLAIGATVLATLLAVPLVLFLHTYLKRGSRVAEIVRLTLDVLWGIPSIVYGAFGFALMIALGMRASLLAGILTLALVVLPLMARTLDEIVTMSPRELRETTMALGATRLEYLSVLVRQTLPGLATAVLLAFARGIGDAASVLFTAGYTNAMPQSLLRPVASLPLAIFFQLSTPFEEVRARAYASALVLTLIILVVSILAQISMRRFGRHVIR